MLHKHYVHATRANAKALRTAAHNIRAGLRSLDSGYNTLAIAMLGQTYNGKPAHALGFDISNIDDDPVMYDVSWGYILGVLDTTLLMTPGANANVLAYATQCCKD